MSQKWANSSGVAANLHGLKLSLGWSGKKRKLIRSHKVCCLCTARVVNILKQAAHQYSSSASQSAPQKYLLAVAAMQQQQQQAVALRSALGAQNWVVLAHCYLLGVIFLPFYDCPARADPQTWLRLRRIRALRELVRGKIFIRRLLPAGPLARRSALNEMCTSIVLTLCCARQLTQFFCYRGIKRNVCASKMTPRGREEWSFEGNVCI
jgi:hypothetical protein